MFIALDVPGPVKDILASVIEQLRPAVPEVRWVPEQNLHLTLSFLGSVDAERVTEISQALGRAAIGLRDGVATLAGLGAFPSERRARVVWVGLHDPAGAVAAMAAATIEAMAEVGFEPEDRPFHPHLTIGRLKIPRPVSFPPGVQVSPATLPVDRITLFQSHLRRPAPMYEPLAVIPFGGR